MDQHAITRWLTSARIVRRLSDALFRRKARRRLAEAERLSPGRGQLRTLLGLVHRARGTRFGRDHALCRVRSTADFRRLVPLRTAAELWRLYGLPALPRLDGSLWPGPIGHLATCDVGLGQTSAPLPVTAELVASHRQALWTALAQVVLNRPHARLLSGSLLFVGGGAALTPLQGYAAAGSLEALVLGQLPRVLRPHTVVAPYSGDVSLRSLAERSESLDVTCLVGNAARLKWLMACLRWWTGKERLAEVWPNLQAVLFTRGPTDPDRAQVAEIVGTPADGRLPKSQRLRKSAVCRGVDTPRSPVMMLEGVVRPEGVFAVEDPRHGLLRVLHDHGVYFEFVPADQISDTQPERHALDEVVPGVRYSLAVTSPAGLWACRTGLTVCFERADPPLLRSVEAAPSVPLLSRPETATAAYPLPARRQRGDGTPGGPARRLARSPWSAHADQG